MAEASTQCAPLSSGRLVKNAVANLLNGASSAILVVVLPPFLVRCLSRPEYSAWSLVLQLGMYTSLLRFSIEIAVGRYIAAANALQNRERRDRILSTALVLLGISSALGAALIAWLSLNLGRWFSQLPPYLLHDSRLSLILIGMVLALGMPATAFGGVLVGEQRYDVLAVINVIGRTLMAGALALVGWKTHGIVPLAITWAASTVLLYLTQVAAALKCVPGLRPSYRLVSRQVAGELFHYCSSLSVWSIAMLLVNGIDSALVGKFQFALTGSYVIAGNLITLISGIQNSVFNTLIPVTAEINVHKGNERRLGDLLITSSRICLVLLIISTIPFFLVGHSILRLWVGQSYAQSMLPLLLILLLANFIRLIATPYAVLLIGVGQQKMVLATPLLEGVINLIASVVLGRRMGAQGVAVGTLIGAAFGLLCHFFYNMPRTHAIQFDFVELVRHGLLPPVLSLIPLVPLYAVITWKMTPPNLGLFAGCVGILICTSVLYRYGITSVEKNQACSAMQRVFRKALP